MYEKMIKFAGGELNASVFMNRQFESDIKALISAYEMQKDRADRLQAELDKMNKRSQDAETKVNELEDKVKVLGLKSAFIPSAAGTQEAKARIDRLVARIDEALALLQ